MTESKQLRVLLAGTFLSGHVGTRAPIEDLAERLKARGYDCICTSSIRWGLLRGADVLSTAVQNRNRFDVAVVDVYSGRAFLWAEALGMLLQSMRIPFVYSLHGGALPEFAASQPARVRKCLSRATSVTSPSRYLLEQMQSYVTTAVVLPNPLDVSQYAFRLRSAVRPNLIWVRRLHRIYNPSLAPRVIALLTKEWPDIRLTMVGRDERDGSSDETMRTARELGVADRIRFTGGVPRTEVASLLESADIFLNTTDIDNTPVSVMEAMACGLCVVSTNPGGLPWLIRDGHDGMLSPCNDAESLAGNIDSLLRSPGYAAKVSASARRTVESFDWSVVLPQWEQLLRSTFETGNRPMVPASTGVSA